MSQLSGIAIELGNILKSEQLNFSGFISTDRQDALDLINELELKKVDNIFKIDTKLFIDRMKKLVENPFMINQGRYGLCTTATFLYVIIKDFPIQFVQYGFQLLATGAGKIGSLNIQPSNDFKNAKFEDIQTLEALKNREYIVIDYLLLGALRDAKNTFFDIELTDYDLNDIDNVGYSIVSKLLDFDAYGGVNADLEYWFNETKLYKKIVYKKALDKDPEKDLDRACRANETIILDIYTEGDDMKLLKKVPDKITGHNCTMLSTKISFISTTGDIMFHAVSWGKRLGVVINPADFKEAFMGYFEVNRL